MTRPRDEESEYGYSRRPARPIDVGLFASVPVDTSEAAADALSAPETLQKVARDRLTLLRLIVGRGGCTVDEMVVLSGLSDNSIRPRIREMREAGLGWVVVSPATRATRTQSPAHILVATEKGRQHLKDLAAHTATI